MQLDTTRFGTIDIKDEAVITFVQPVIGFQNERRYTIIPGPEDSLVHWLQSVDSGDLAFLLMDPTLAVPDYTVDLRPDELKDLGAQDIQEIDVYTLVVVPHDQSLVRTNLKAPVLINPRERLGKQAILDRSNYPIQFFLAQAEQETPAEQGG